MRHLLSFRGEFSFPNSRLKLSASPQHKQPFDRAMGFLAPRLINPNHGMSRRVIARSFRL